MYEQPLSQRHNEHSLVQHATLPISIHPVVHTASASSFSREHEKTTPLPMRMTANIS